ncbi:MAG TPA: hypothetical protein VL860_08185, partial [Planctomycetota bacterium]|nr:hypothetical protein [Planctomycetota bacterium]
VLWQPGEPDTLALFKLKTGRLTWQAADTFVKYLIVEARDLRVAAVIQSSAMAAVIGTRGTIELARPEPKLAAGEMDHRRVKVSVEKGQFEITRTGVASGVAAEKIVLAAGEHRTFKPGSMVTDDEDGDDHDRDDDDDDEEEGGNLPARENRPTAPAAPPRPVEKEF